MTTWIRRSPEVDALVAEEDLVLAATEMVYEAMESAGVNKAGLAKRLGVQPSEITQRLRGQRNLTLRSLARMMGALGFEVSLAAAPRDEAEPAAREARIGLRVTQELAPPEKSLVRTRLYFIVMTFNAYPVEELKQAGEALERSLERLGNVRKPQVKVSEQDGRVHVAMYIPATSRGHAITCAEDALAEAIHHNGDLADWEERAEAALRQDHFRTEVELAGDLLPA